MKNLLIVHGVNYWNIGDLGITDAMISTLNKKLPQANITFVTPYYSWPKPKNSKLEQKIVLKPDIFLFPSKLEISSLINKVEYYTKSSFNLIRIILFTLFYKLFRKEFFFILNDSQKEAVKSYFNSDLVISKGGGFLYDHGRFLLSPHLIPIIFAKILGKPVIIYAQSIGPFKRKFSGFLYKIILKRIDIIIVRERLSQKILSNMNIKSILGYDAAFDLEKSKDIASIKRLDSLIASKRKGRDLLVGMSILNWKFPDISYNKIGEYKERYFSALAEVINNLNNKYNCFFFFFPYSVGGLESEDIYAIKNVLNKTNLNKNYLIFEAGHNPRLFSHILGKMDLCIGTRMHSNIFALISNTPLVAISYLPKT